MVIASAFVKDIYVGLIDRNASENRLRWASRCSILLIGMIAVLANLWGIDSLQAIVLFNNESQAATFVVPVVMLAFWRRATVSGVRAAMLTGFLTVLILFVFGWINNALEQGQHIGMESRIPSTLFIDGIAGGVGFGCLHDRWHHGFDAHQAAQPSTGRSSLRMSERASRLYSSDSSRRLYTPKLKRADATKRTIVTTAQNTAAMTDHSPRLC